MATGDGVVIIGRRVGISTGQLLGKISARVPRVYRRDGVTVGELSLRNTF